MVRYLLAAAVFVMCGMSALATPIPSGIGEGLHKHVGSRSIRQEAAELPRGGAILYGRVTIPTSDKDGTERADFLTETVLREGKVKVPAKLVLPHFLAVEDPKSPPRYLVFCECDEKKIDPYRGMPLTGGAKSLAYVKKALAMGPKSSVDQLPFFFAHLDDADPEIAKDAFVELSLASDRAILAAAHTFSAVKLRAWMKNPKTPYRRLYLYAQLLGACGKKELPFLRGLLANRDERYEGATDGIMLGCVWASPKEGWNLLHSTFRDRKMGFRQRFAAVRVARYMRETQPTETRANFVKAMRAAMRDPELADIPIEELRRARIWDLTPEVLKMYDRKPFDNPLVKRAIIRYALCCEPTDATKSFLDARRRDNKEMVEDSEEALKLDAD